MAQKRPAVWEDPTAPDAPAGRDPITGQPMDWALPHIPDPPDSRSPRTFVMAELTAIRVLVKLYGWTWDAAGVLRRPGR